MSKSIKISPKYGVNPTMPICFFCGEPTGEIALLGHIKDKDFKGKAIPGSDVEAPKSMILNYEPCDTCKENMSKGITIIEVIEKNNAPANAVEICPGAVPTGTWSVIKTEAFERIFKDILTTEAYEKTINMKKCFLESKIYQHFFNNN